MHTNIIGISSFHNGLIHPFSWTGLYFTKKLWEVVMKYKNFMFFSFQNFFLNFFSRLVLT